MSLKINWLGFVTVTAMLLWATGCYYDETVLIEKEVTTEISFSGDIIPILNTSCNISGCHNAGGTPPVLTADKAYNNLINGNYVDIAVPENSELHKWLTGKRNTPMPLTGPDPNINAKVLAWIKQGALNN
jgi:hypothetical protein